MSKVNKLLILLISLIIFTFQNQEVTAQSDSADVKPGSKLILWKAVNIGEQNLLLGPGGEEMKPDLSKITLIKEESGGHSTKYRIKDGADHEWVAKVGNESQPETVSVRLLWALGYKSEINYLVPELKIPGAGEFKNVRLEARPENIKRKENWKWDDNPFLKTDEFQGLKIMMALLNNWDLKTPNNVILQNGEANEDYYVVSDLGVSFGQLGSNGLPIFWRIGRSRNEPIDYSQSKFIKDVKDNKLELVYNGKSPGIFDDITVDQARWITSLLVQLRDQQIADAFRAANYSEDDMNLLMQEFKNRIEELKQVTSKTEAVK